MFEWRSMKKVFVIAEAGVNHNGSLQSAKKLIDVAAEAGADAVKFQAFKAQSLVTKKAKTADYQKQQTGEFDQHEMLKKLELDMESHKILQDYCVDKNILFLSSAFDLESIDGLAQLNLPLFKIPSGEITNYTYLKKIASYSKPVILSTGMATMNEISEALDLLIKFGIDKKDITVLHCNTEYPTPLADVHLRAMATIAKEFNVEIGYSDHTQGVEVAVAAVALGAKVIEKHFTLDKTLPGPDHKASLDPDELKLMIKLIRNIELALGGEIKQPSPSEIKNIEAARKSIVASRLINKGETFSDENLTAKRPGIGLSPMLWNEIVGKKATRSFEVDEMIEI
jgi:N,N'-diacetyllegionaminate synthase